MTALRSGTAQAVDHLKKTKAEPMQAILRQAKFVAQTSMPVLIEGETGTGKEVLASLIHQSSRRNEGNFIAVNCAAVPSELAEAEFFGHKKGAFTGAAIERKGYFKAADRGTLFLDEVGELSLPLQAKLLRALQEKKVLPVGSDTEVEVDVRVVAATKRDLSEMVKAGTFREDLYYRLNVVSLHMPPLRDRPEDIPPLAAYFLQKHIADNTLPELHLPEHAVLALQKYDWPGNIRQMSNAIAGAAIRAMSAARNIITPEDLLLPIKQEIVSVRALPDFKVAHGIRTPAIIDRGLLPEAELDTLVLSRPSAAIIFNLACKVMSRLSLRSFVETTLRAAPYKLSLAAIAQQQDVPVRAVKESMHVARQAILYQLEKEHPELLNSPIIRKRVYQMMDEDGAQYPYFDSERAATLTPEGRDNLEIASLLLNNKAYHQAAWGLTIPKDGLQQAFDREASLNGTINYFTLLKALRDFRQKAHLVSIEDQQYASAPSVAKH